MKISILILPDILLPVLHISTGMYRLADLRDGRSLWRATALALAVLAVSIFAVVGFIAATASLVAGFGHPKASALRVAVVSGGGLLLAGFLASARPTGAGRRRALAGVGTALAVGGLALFWASLPAGWTGSLAELPPVALGAYAAGLLAVFGGGLVAPGDSGGRGDSGDGEAERSEGGPLAAVEVPALSRSDGSSDGQDAASAADSDSEDSEHSVGEART